MIDIRQSQNYAKYMKSLDWSVERIAEINYFIKKVPLLGAILKVQRPEEIRIDTVDGLCRKYGVFQLIIEPKNNFDAEYLTSLGFKLAQSTYLPSKTLQIDLTKSSKTILENFKKDVRYALRKGGDLKLKEYSTSEDIRILRKEWQKAVKLKRFVPSTEQLIKLKKSFPQSNSLFLMSHNISGSALGGAIFTTSSHGSIKDIAYYWQAFTNKEGRALLSQYSLLFQGILWAKKNGFKVFDFEGVYDSRFPNKSWLGFTHFKEAFGGYEVEYPGTYVKYRLPFGFAK